MTDRTPPTELGQTPAADRRGFLFAYAAVAAFIVIQDAVNALTVGHDLPQLAPWKPFIWEYSSGVVLLALVPAVGWLLARAPPRPGRMLRFVAVHALGSVAFSLAHVGGFVAIRKAIYALLGTSYGGTDLLYEYPKDAAAYVLIAAALWLGNWAAGLWARSRTPPPATTIYHLRDGATTVRVPPGEIIAVSSARNYVEFHLAGGRKPLVRTTMAAVERELAGCGFLRTHRSWLVNAAHVRAVTPAAGGDFRLELASGFSAPLSRRFPQALARLRSPQQAAA